MKASMLLLFLVLCFSCKEEQISPTQGQLTAKKLATELGVSFDAAVTKYATIVSAFETNTTLFSGSTLILSSDGFIKIVEGQSAMVFNLDFLKSYQVSGSNLKLVF